MTYTSSCLPFSITFAEVDIISVLYQSAFTYVCYVGYYLRITCWMCVPFLLSIGTVELAAACVYCLVLDQQYIMTTHTIRRPWRGVQVELWQDVIHCCCCYCYCFCVSWWYFPSARKACPAVELNFTCFFLGSAHWMLLRLRIVNWDDISKRQLLLGGGAVSRIY